MSRFPLVCLISLIFTAAGCFHVASAVDPPYSVSSSTPWNVDQSTTPILITASGVNIDSMAAFSSESQPLQWLFLSPLKPRVFARYDVSLGQEVAPLNFTATGLTNPFGFDVLKMTPLDLVTSVRGQRIVMVAAYQSQTVIVSMNSAGQWLAAMAVAGFRAMDIDRSGVNVLAVSSTAGVSVYTIDTLVPVASVATTTTGSQYYGVAFKPDGTVMVAVNTTAGVNGIQQYDSGLKALSFRTATIRGFTGANFLVDQSDCMIWRGPRGEWHYLSLRDQAFVAVSAFNASALAMSDAGQLVVLAYNATTSPTTTLLYFNRTQAAYPSRSSSSSSSSSTGGNSSTPTGNSGGDSSSDDHRGAVIGLAVTVGALAVALAILALVLLRVRHGNGKPQQKVDGSTSRELSASLA